MRQFVLSLCLPLVASLGVACSVQQADDTPAPCTTDTQKAVDTDKDGLGDCQEQTLGTDANKYDTDAEGLGDGDEYLKLKTDPLKVDTDGDGLDDLKELQCVSNPLDNNEKCYAGGWFHNDPRNLVSNGKTEGNVIGNMNLSDQFGETVSLWDFANTPKSPTNVWASLIKNFAAPKPEYHILFMTAAW